MTELKAVEATLEIWRKRAKGKRETAGCALCSYDGEQMILHNTALCFCCSVYKGTERKCCTPGEPYKDYLKANTEKGKLNAARRAVALLEKTRDRILAEVNA